MVLRPTVVPGAPGEAWRRPGPADGRDAQRLARDLDAVLADAVQDLGLTLDMDRRASEDVQEPDDVELVRAAEEAWVLAPTLRVDGTRALLRIVVVPRGSSVVLSRTESVGADDLDVTAMRMVRDLVEAGRGTPSSAPITEGPARGPALVYRARSQGRAVLALNSAVLGGYVGFSVQRASGNEDPRLLYPLIALGTGIGLGGSVIVADEWDVGLGDAWYLSAAAWWPTASGLLLADGYGVTPRRDRHVYGLVGATSGITLGTVALTFGGMSEGGAVLTHSGGALGTLLGALGELAVEGDASVTPSRGMGFGAGAGVLAAGALATQLKPTASRVLLVDLGGMLGALTGAAAASPLVIDDEKDRTNVRLWLGSTAVGTLAGVSIAYLVTEPPKHASMDTGERLARPALRVAPYGGVIASSRVGNREEPAIGAGLTGTW